MTHDEEVLLEDYALGMLDCNHERARQAEQLIQRLHGSELDEWLAIQTAINSIPRSLEPIDPPRELKQLIVGKIREDHAQTLRANAFAMSRSVNSLWSVASTFATACVVGFFCLGTGILVGQLDRSHDRASLSLRRADGNFGKVNARATARQIPSLQHASFSEKLISKNASPSLQNAHEGNPSISGKPPRFVLFVDQLMHQIHIIALGLDTNSSGCNYKISLSMANGHNLSIGELQPHASGVAHALLPFPLTTVEPIQTIGPLHAKVIQRCDNGDASNAVRVTLDTDFQLTL